MRNLINILLRYHFVILFIFIEGISVFILFQNNDYQKAGFFNFSKTLGSSYYKKADALREYISLRQMNRKLMDENAKLRNLLPGSVLNIDTTFKEKTDTAHKIHYRYTAAKVINNSTNKRYNYITLDKGREQGIQPGMGVISGDGIVGIVDAVSDHFSLVISLLNRDFRVSAKIRKNNYFGPLEWPGRNASIASLNEIPLHVKVQKSDTIVTSGYTSVFPEDIPVGYVEDYKITNGSFYTIRVRLSNDFGKLEFVTVVQNQMSAEQKDLERIMKND